jgi:hypothetical protein
MAAWGPQDLLAPYSKRPHLFPRPLMEVTLGPPVDLSDLSGSAADPATLRVATDRIMAAVTDLVAELRGEPAPPTRLDPRDAELATTGDAHVVYHLDRHQRRRTRPPAVPGPGQDAEPRS